MKQMLTAALALLLTAGLSGCGGSGPLTKYDTGGLLYIAYTDIDTVCAREELTDAGADFLRSQGDGLLLSYVVDSAIELTGGELGTYDHLILTNRRWVERFGDVQKLRPADPDSVTADMEAFLECQMPLLTADGAVLPPGAALYEYAGGGLLAFPVNVTLGAAEAIEAENPLLLLLENPAEDLSAGSCLLPLTSSGNILFADQDSLTDTFAASELNAYGTLEKLAN